jgi:hypothetical protein
MEIFSYIMSVDTSQTGVEVFLAIKTLLEQEVFNMVEAVNLVVWNCGLYPRVKRAANNL